MDSFPEMYNDPSFSQTVKMPKKKYPSWPNAQSISILYMLHVKIKLSVIITTKTSPTLKFNDWETSTEEGTVPLKSKLTLDARNSRLDPRVSKLERFEFQDVRIESWDTRIQEARFSERTKLYSHIAVQIFAPSISACDAVFCNCLNRPGSPSFQ